jgi:triosephosphate isomerase
MADRVPMIAANWKMNKTVEEAQEFCDALLPAIEGAAAEVVICPPFLALATVAEATKLGPVVVAGQNMYFEDAGAYTGEVSPAMLLDAGAGAVVLGHSERRQMFGETDEALGRKVPAALAAGLTPILCVGETDEERECDYTDRVLRRQIDAGLSRVEAGRLGEVVVAYEPIWAIGTGKTATPEQADDACGFVRSLIAGRDEEAAERVRILYGGSMKPGNAADLLARSEIDGGLIGGASLDPGDFAQIVAAAG